MLERYVARSGRVSRYRAMPVGDRRSQAAASSGSRRVVHLHRDWVAIPAGVGALRSWSLGEQVVRHDGE